jgi:hypothetical protein
VLTTLPSTATPSVPPTSRTTSFIADPIPAFAFGSEPMIASVTGAIARPMPKPIAVREPATFVKYAVSPRSSS